MKPILLIDVSWLAWRAFYTTGDLSYKDVKTGIIYGILRDIITFQRRWNTDRVVFAFDSKQSLRARYTPSYKANRRDKEFTKAEERSYYEMKRQMKLLRKVYLPLLGFKNILFQRGYEADDLICKCALSSIGIPEDVIIISADKDLYQILGAGVRMYVPGLKPKVITLQSFYKEYGVRPRQWPMVKAIAGCKGDNVIGIKGIGEKTAIKFMLDRLDPKSKAAETIRLNKKVIIRNLRLVKLPYPGCETQPLVENEVTPKRWRKVVKELGMNSLADALLMP